MTISHSEPRVATERRALVLVLVGLILGPLCLRGVASLIPPQAAQPSYLPALESSRPRLPFRSEVVDQLRRQQPTFVFIGDSMLGSRVDPILLGDLAGNEQVAFLYHAGTGPIWWYLALKNYLIPSQIKPRFVFVFFRDTNLTDTMFRATGNFRWALDEVARETERTLDGIVAARLNGDWHATVQRVQRWLGVEELLPFTDTWMKQAPMRALTTAEGFEDFEHRVNGFFSIDALRPFTQADLGEEEALRTDFATEVQTSVLPEMFRLARVSGYRLCFVRVQRRPTGTRPPAQSPELRRYLEDLEAYLRANGAEYYDEHGDSDYPESVYADGDHLRRDFREQYTRLFHGKLATLFK